MVTGRGPLQYLRPSPPVTVLGSDRAHCWMMSACVAHVELCQPRVGAGPQVAMLRIRVPQRRSPGLVLPGLRCLTGMTGSPDTYRPHGPTVGALGDTTINLRHCQITHYSVHNR